MKLLQISLITIVICGSMCLAAPPRRRKNIETLTPEELLSYRELVQSALNDGSFSTVAGWHGMPLMSIPDQTGFCVHGTPAFLMWHRFYVAVMEMIIGCPIPYWDWRSPRIPRAFSDRVYTARNGSTAANPLYSAFLPVDVRTLDNPGPSAERAPQSPFPSVDLGEKEDYALYATTEFKAFSSALEDCHNLAHVALGGALQYLDVAAFDPMFWSLHMNTERMFFQWQLMNDNYQYPPDIAQMPIVLKSYTVSASDLLPYFDGWQAGTSAREIRSWKASLKAALAKRKKSPTPKFGVLEDTSPVANTTMNPLVDLIMMPNSSRVPAISPNQVASQILASSNATQPILAASNATQPILAASNATQPQLLSLANGTNGTSNATAAIPVPSAVLGPALQTPISRSRFGLRTNSTNFLTMWPIEENVESPFPVVEIAAGATEDHVMLHLKQVPSTQKPSILLTILNGRVVGKTGMFGMGNSPMTAFVMDRPVDLSRAYEKLGFRANGTKPEDLLKLVEFRMEDCKTGIQTPYKPPAVAIDPKCF